MVLDLQDVPACWQVLCNYDPGRLGQHRLGLDLEIPILLVCELSMQDQVCPAIHVAYLCGTSGIDVYSQHVEVGVFLEEFFVEDLVPISIDIHLD